jgi:O-antigen biosynthesis protein
MMPNTQLETTPDMQWQLMPLHQLMSVEDADGHEIWEATGVDPQFKVVRSDGGKIAGGWYLISAKVEFYESFLQNPCVYPSYDGFLSESSKVPIQVSSPFDWSIPSLLRFTQGSSYLRIDPSDRPCRFTFNELKIAKIGKLEAAKFLLGRLWSRALGRRNKLKFSLKLLPFLLTLRIKALGDWLWETYAGTTHTTYGRWVQNFDTPSVFDRRQEVARAEKLAYQPTFSILVPVYNTDEIWLEKCIESVLAQTYKKWELCIADDASSKSHIKKVLQKYSDSDVRIKTVLRDSNGHISLASNSALAVATGEYVVLLDHDDELPSCALFEVALAVNENRNLKLIYSDEDKIDLEGRRFDPYFKPDWNYELFLSQNCISHLGVFARDLVNSVGGFRQGYEGSQDYDLALRCIEKIDPAEIGHIEKVLYHWRAIPGSTAVGMQEKNYASLAAVRAIQDHLQRIGVNKAGVQEITGMGGAYRVDYCLEEKPLVSIMIPTRDKPEVLKRAIDSILLHSSYENYEILVVDNQSREPETKQYFEQLRGQPNISILEYDKPFNYSAINNYAAHQASGSMLLLLNNDVEIITPGWIEELLATALKPGVGAVGAMLYFPNNTIQHAGIILGFNGVAVNAYAHQMRGFTGQVGRARLRQAMSAVTGACLMIKKDTYLEVGGMNENLAVAFNDVDFCLRLLSRGYRNVWTPFAELIHHESLTRGVDDSSEKRKRFLNEIQYMREKWREILDNDPAYNRNLELSGDLFSLAFPPRSLHMAYAGRLFRLMKPNR